LHGKNASPCLTNTDQVASKPIGYKKGEKGTTAVYADRFITYRERARAAETGDEPEAIPFLKTLHGL
jgi:antirestriction protein ArdC